MICVNAIVKENSRIYQRPVMGQERNAADLHTGQIIPNKYLSQWVRSSLIIKRGPTSFRGILGDQVVVQGAICKGIGGLHVRAGIFQFNCDLGTRNGGGRSAIIDDGRSGYKFLWQQPDQKCQRNQYGNCFFSVPLCAVLFTVFY